MESQPQILNSGITMKFLPMYNAEIFAMLCMMYGSKPLKIFLVKHHSMPIAANHFYFREVFF